MNERIKKLRKFLDLTQQEFAEKIGTARNNIAGYEVARRSPSEAVISLICKTFNVSETWLRTGEGEMFVQTAEDPVERLCEELHATELDAEIIRVYFKIDERIREPFMRKLLEQVHASAAGKDIPVPPAMDTSGPEGTGLDVAAELAELKRQNQELTARIAAMEEEERDEQLKADFGAAFSALQSGLAGGSEKGKK